MQVQRVQTTNQTTFGTKLGKNLSEFIMSNRDGFLTSQLINIGRIKRNKFPDTVLELEPASLREQKMFNYIYKLNLHNEDIDKKNYILRSVNCIHEVFQHFLAVKNNGQEIVPDKRFPIYIKDLKDSTWILVAKQFDNNRLAEKIEEEVNQSKIIVNEFDNFERNYISKYNK